ncbi:MAG: hypothetical protein IAC51_06005 [bacterium]|uniref:Uncharacterized protein n=1 Tax=Candidatus Aphodosoma intestinipullorum TaxID=2840674 RepID=A0A940IEE5_9BACT|nr:hypothetical protein [Candidatus Aphodosoma intestinipullorum]
MSGEEIEHEGDDGLYGLCERSGQLSKRSVVIAPYQKELFFLSSVG